MPSLDSGSRFPCTAHKCPSPHPVIRTQLGLLHDSGPRDCNFRILNKCSWPLTLLCMFRLIGGQGKVMFPPPHTLKRGCTHLLPRHLLPPQTGLASWGPSPAPQLKHHGPQGGCTQDPVSHYPPPLQITSGHRLLASVYFAAFPRPPLMCNFKGRSATAGAALVSLVRATQQQPINSYWPTNVC